MNSVYNLKKRRYEMSQLSILVVAVFILAGCDASSGKKSDNVKKSSETTVSDVADYSTGLTSLKAEKKAEEMLNKINAKKQKQSVPAK